MKFVQKLHAIILEGFAGLLTVCAVKTMNFQHGSPSYRGNGYAAHIRSAARTTTNAESPRPAKAGSLAPKVLGHVHRLREITHEFAFANRSAENAGRDKLLDREFPFRIELPLLSNGRSRLLQQAQNRLAVVMPLRGSLSVDLGESPLDLCAGEILIAPDLNISVRARTEEADVEVLVISFLPRFVYSLGSPSCDYFFLLPFYANYALTAPIVREGPSLNEIQRIIAGLVQCYCERQNYFELGCKALFLELLYHIARQFSDVESIRSQMISHTARVARLTPVVEFVEANFQETITLAEAASHAKMSVPQFVRLFKRIAGMSFITYLTHVRLSRAIRLLSEGSLSIAQVAYEVGFSDQSYFDRRFKEAFGQTPRDFRQIQAVHSCGTKKSQQPILENTKGPR